MFPFIAAFAQAGGIIVDKITLTRRQVSVRVFVPAIFLFLFLLTMLFVPFLGRVSSDIFQTKYILIFCAMIVSAIIWNIYYYRGVQTEKVHEFEMIMMLQPLLTVLLATIFLKGERNINLEIAAIIASLALIAAHLNKRHLEFSDGVWGLLLAVIFTSIEIILIKLLLDVINPVALYAVRTGILFVFFYLFYHPDLTKMSEKNVWLVLLTSAIGMTQMIMKFYGFTEYGVIYTSLILIVAPVLVYLISRIYLHEKIKARTIFATFIILIAIVYASVIGYF